MAAHRRVGPYQVRCVRIGPDIIPQGAEDCAQAGASRAPIAASQKIAALAGPLLARNDTGNSLHAQPKAASAAMTAPRLLNNHPRKVKEADALANYEAAP